ncbi:MAG: hypothetical protein IKM34_05995 [Clostridia bacterium]|nr:hypothetical protein [Clostridia bacterium]
MLKISIKTKSVPITKGDAWLVKIEKAAFGWEYLGEHTEHLEWDEDYEERSTTYEHYDNLLVERTTIEKGTRRKSKITSYHDFARVSPYSYNAVFHVFEMLSGIFSTIRRWAVMIVGFIAVLGVVGLVLSMLTNNPMDDILYPLGILLLVYVFGIVVPSFVIAEVGRLLRNKLEIDKKAENILRENNYNPKWREMFKK